MGEESDMTVSMSPTTQAVRGVLVDPPLGLVRIDLTDDRMEMQFSNGHIESFPTSAVGFIGHDDASVALNWAGTPIVIRCTDSADATNLRHHLDTMGFDALEDGELRGFRLGFGGSVES